MGRTNTKKLEAREARLKALPQSERLTKSALIKKKEGRVLDASEKHALKMTSEHGDILRLWEKLRTIEDTAGGKEGESASTDKKTAFEHKYPVVEKLVHIIEPKFPTLVRTPSVSRVIQSMIKYGSPAHVAKVTKWISKDFTTFSTDAYAHFVITALIRHVPHDTFKKLLAFVIPAVPQLISHKFGIEVIHAVYSSRWCNSLDRDLILLSIFKDNVAVMKQWSGYPVLEDVIQGNPSLRKRLLTRLFDLSDKLVSQKEAVGYPFVQRLVYAFVRHGTRDEVSELCDTIRPHIATVAMTREGAPLASLAFALTEPKKRKEILRAFNDHLGELSTSKYSAPVVARLFDLLYDPQLLHKYLLKDMVEHISQHVNSPYGYLILIHLLTPDAARKEKLMLPNWSQHNLYSSGNKEWNHHTWLTADYATEVVEICSKPAAASHLLAIPELVAAFVKLVEEAEAASKKINRHNVSLIAREILTVSASHPEYRSAMKLTDAQRKLLEGVAPAQGKRPREEDEEEEKSAVPEPAAKQAKKKVKGDAAASAKPAKKVIKKVSKK